MPPLSYLVYFLPLLAPLATGLQATTPATPPSKQCVDIQCYKPVTWEDTKEEVCRHHKERICEDKQMEVCKEVPYTECELVPYAKCEEKSHPEKVRNDTVLGKGAIGHTCVTQPKMVWEVKEKPHCENMTKEVCEEMWIPEAPFWKKVNCQSKTWENCTLVPYHHQVEIEDFCDCTETEVWYDQYKQNTTTVDLWRSACKPDAAIQCTYTTIKKCTQVHWKECKDNVVKVCGMQHFKQPSQEVDHRRWCSHVEILFDNPNKKSGK